MMVADCRFAQVAGAIRRGSNPRASVQRRDAPTPHDSVPSPRWNVEEVHAMSESQSNQSDDDVQLPETIENTEATTGTEFRDTILYVIAGLDKLPYGLAIKRELEDYYGKEVNHGRLYPNLDILIERGYLQKSQVDKRTNKYELTEKAREYLLADIAWEANQLDLAVEEAVHQEWSE